MSSWRNCSRRGTRLVTMVAVCAIGFATGCGSSVEYAEVEGKVTVNAKPAVCVLVRFYPVSKEREQLPYASALTDAQGHYVLMHDDDKPGAVVGTSRVVVQWPARDVLAAYGNGLKPGPPIPLPYTTATQTPIQVEVKSTKSGARQTIDLKLESKQ